MGTNIKFHKISDLLAEADVGVLKGRRRLGLDDAESVSPVATGTKSLLCSALQNISPTQRPFLPYKFEDLFVNFKLIKVEHKGFPVNANELGSVISLP